MAPFNVRSKVCIAPIHVRSKICIFSCSYFNAMRDPNNFLSSGRTAEKGETVTREKIRCAGLVEYECHIRMATSDRVFVVFVKEFQWNQTKIFGGGPAASPDSSHGCKI